MSPFRIVTRWKRSASQRSTLESLVLSGPKPSDPIRDRLNWLLELMFWIRSPGELTLPGVDFKSGQAQAARVKLLLRTLNQQPTAKLGTARALRSIVKDTRALDLFSLTGLPGEAGFFAEMLERILQRMLPSPPKESDIGEVFHLLFSSQEDTLWLKRLDADVLKEIGDLFSYGIQTEDESHWNSLMDDMEDAFLLLAGHAKTIGLSPWMRKRLPSTRVVDSPFFTLMESAGAIVENRKLGQSAGVEKSVARFEKDSAECRAQIESVYSHLDRHGVSVAIVYHLDRTEAVLDRLQTLKNLIVRPHFGGEPFIDFVFDLVREAQSQKTLSGMLSENLSMLSRKIVERSAETGHHYITRNKKEHWMMVKSSLGGGFLTAFTALLKHAIEPLPISYFGKGLLASVNYGFSFIAIQLCGFTLASKQPAMTAAALASKMRNLKRQGALDELIDELVHLVRSQAASVFGNIGGIVPTIVIIDLLSKWISRSHAVTADSAQEILHGHSILGLTPLHAAYTGVLLWFSSVIAGWIDNFSAYREIPAALRHHRRMLFFLGPKKLNRIVNFYERNLAGFSANISLGFLLGLTPKILSFFGIPVEVRHVTLAAGNIAFACASLGSAVFRTSAFWLAMAGLVSIGVLNLSVSFGLSFWIATRARRIRAPQRRAIYKNLWLRFLKSPLSFFVAEND